MVTARRSGRILVWPSHTIAHAADAVAAAESKHGETCPKVTVWPTYQQAAANAEYNVSPVEDGEWLLTGGIWNDAGVWDDTAVWED